MKLTNAVSVLGVQENESRRIVDSHRQPQPNRRAHSHRQCTTMQVRNKVEHCTSGMSDKEKCVETAHRRAMMFGLGLLIPTVPSAKAEPSFMESLKKRIEEDKEKQRVRDEELLTAPISTGGFSNFGPHAGFEFQYPTGWVTAIKRDPKPSAEQETLALVGNFRDVDTFTVGRTHIDQLNGSFESKSNEEIANMLTSEQRFAPGTLRFELSNCQDRSSDKDRAGLRYIQYEYSIEICRGSKVEGSDGVFQCLGPPPKNIDLQTVPRRAVAISVIVDDYVYTAAASTPEERWPEVSNMLFPSIESFHMLQ